MNVQTTNKDQAKSDSSRAWSVRDATAADAPGVAAALTELLTELGGSPPPRQSLEVAAAGTIADATRGCIMVAVSSERGLLGVLAASWQHAVHVPGRYCILQDLWTHPCWRSDGIGAALVTALTDRMRELDIDRVEVGLPAAGFAALADTEAFYLENGFTPLGPRMRRMLR